MWVVLTHHVADDAAALGEPAVGAVAPVVHRVEHTTVHRLQAVAHVRQRAGHDDGHRIVEEAALHLDFEPDRLDAIPGWRSGDLGQRSSLDVEEANVFGVARDERTPRFDVLTHQHREQFVRRGRIVEGDL